MPRAERSQKAECRRQKRERRAGASQRPRAKATEDGRLTWCGSVHSPKRFRRELPYPYVVVGHGRNHNRPCPGNSPQITRGIAFEEPLEGPKQ